MPPDNLLSVLCVSGLSSGQDAGPWISSNLRGFRLQEASHRVYVAFGL